MAASNTPDAVREFIGQKLAGVLFGQPFPGHSHSSIAFTLVFSSGRGLLVYNSGAYAQLSAKDIARGINHREELLTQAKDELEGLVALAGRIPTLPPDKPNVKKTKSKGSSK